MIYWNEERLQKAFGEIRQIFRQHGRVELSYKASKKRSLDQNAIMHAWYQQISVELAEDSVRDVTRFCKLHFGVPILRAADDEFRQFYDGALKHTLSYEHKLEAMDFLPVTRLMKTAQMSEHLEAMQKHYQGRGVWLEFPNEDMQSLPREV